MEKNLHPNYLKSARLLFLSGGIYILQEILTSDIQSADSDHGLVVIVSGLLTFCLAWLVKRGHGWLKYLFVVCLVLSLFMTRPASEEVNHSLVETVFLVVGCLLQLWAIVLLFMIPGREKVIVEE